MQLQFKKTNQNMWFGIIVAKILEVSSFKKFEIEVKS